MRRLRPLIVVKQTHKSITYVFLIYFPPIAHYILAYLHPSMQRKSSIRLIKLELPLNVVDGIVHYTVI